MGIQQKNLSILFRCIQPEVLYQNIFGAGIEDTNRFSANHVPQDVFQYVAHSWYPSYSYEEISHAHRMAVKQMEPLSEYHGCAPSVFYLLVHMGQRALRQNGKGLVCDFSQMFAWRTVYQELGQDVFTTAFLAYDDLRRGVFGRESFTWDAVIKTDNMRLQTILRQGIAENHCHLGGTTQAFPLTWAALMNYPHIACRKLKTLKSNLHPTLSRGVTGNVWSWEKRILWAVYLRLRLFQILEGGYGGGSEITDLERVCFYPEKYVENQVESLRFCCGAAVPQPEGRMCVLDYALRARDCSDGLLKEHNRLLSGERSFLYRCFQACFDGSFTPALQTWFYLYLLIKSNFRAEIIQNNKQYGFRNFKDYQDRKMSFYGGIPGYRAEMIRLAVNENQKSQRIVSFEMRINPGTSSAELIRTLRNCDKQIEFAGGLDPDAQQFYVYHFNKKPDQEEVGSSVLFKPRNAAARRQCTQRTYAIAHALQCSPFFCSRVFGIDAASTEIGCRPEVFAAAFRFLRSLTPIPCKRGPLDFSTTPHMHATYHAGEDFLDMADGLRSIDEAFRFLHLRRGDRIGHALALGVEPEVHYATKKRRVLLSGQEHLDNIVWLLYRSQELDVCMPAWLRSHLQTCAEKLLAQIYGPIIRANHWHIGLHDYYYSMNLRGDAPELYFSMRYEKPRYFWSAYQQHLEDPTPELEEYRKSAAIAGLNYCYYYDRDVRCRGGGPYEFSVSDAYMELIREMQEKLSRELGKKGIMVECNPTSNYLIGTFQRYDCHPIFRFNNAGLVYENGSYTSTPQLSVSINTDDLGVFDTSLENEYAILAASMERAQNPDKSKKYTSDSIYQYLDNIRKMGFEQSFFLAEKDCHSSVNVALLESCDKPLCLEPFYKADCSVSRKQ